MAKIIVSGGHGGWKPGRDACVRLSVPETA
jgi:hypothetical protein